MTGFEGYLWYFFVLDVLVANVIAWCYPGWYKKNFPKLSRMLPLTKLWAVVYAVLIAWVGFTLHRAGIVTCFG